jgi:5,10-methylenetetrahydromethanopterin reductase
VITSSINVIPEGPIDDLVALGVLAEDLGYSRCWVYDEGLATRDVYITLAAIAAATTRLQLGTGITNPYTRHPATTAAAVASLDEMSAGRAFLGIGAGGSLTLDPLGIPRTAPLATVRDAITACRRLLDGEQVTMTGQGFELRGAQIGFPTRRGIEIWLAGRGPKMLALGGEVTDGVMLDFIHKPSLGDYIGRVRGVTGTSTARVCYSTMVITDERAMEQTKPHMTYRLVDSPPEVREMIGISDAEVQTIRSAMAGGLHAAAEHVRDEWVLPFVISGSVDECAAEIGTLVERYGIDEFLLPVLDLHDAPALMHTVARVMRKVS